VEFRRALIWTVLLLAGQAADVITTQVDRARGALESMPISSGLLQQGGLGLFWATKVLEVGAASTALFLTALWIRSKRPGAPIVFRIALVAVQAVTIGLVCAALVNAALLGSLV
jgi:hypothetical protein